MSEPAFDFLFPPANEFRVALARFASLDRSVATDIGTERICATHASIGPGMFTAVWTWEVERYSVYENDRRTTTFTLKAYVTFSSHVNREFRAMVARHKYYVPHTEFEFHVEVDCEGNPVGAHTRVTAMSND